MQETRDEFNRVNQVFVNEGERILQESKDVLIGNGIVKYDVSNVLLTARETPDTPLFSKEHAQLFEAMSAVLKNYGLDAYRVTDATIVLEGAQAEVTDTPVAPEDAQYECAGTWMCHWECNAGFICGTWLF